MGGDLGFLMVVVTGGDCEWCVGCFCLEKRDAHGERERKRCLMENKKELKILNK